MLESLGHEYRNLEGDLVDAEAIKPWLSAKSKASRQGVKSEIILRDYALDKVQALTFNRTGKTYLVIEDTASAAAA